MNIPWILVRASGFAAYAMLAASTVWGLLLSIGMLGRSVSAKGVTRVHESLAIGAVLATGLHLLFLWADSYVHFGPAELFVPGASAWRPVPVAFGIVAMYALLLTTFSFYVRRFIGQSRWRMLHFATFGVFAAAAWHGVAAGADTGSMIGQAVYIGSVVLVAGLVAVRFVVAGAARGRSPAGSNRRPQAEAADGAVPAADPA